MIELTGYETLALNGLIDSEALYGIKLPKIMKEEEEKITKEVVASLEKKEFFNEGKLSDKLFITTKMLEEYKKSERYVFINRMRIGMRDSDEVQIIEMDNDELRLGRIQRINIVRQIIEKSEFLKREQKLRFFEYEEKECSEEEHEEYVNSKNEEWKDMLVIQVHEQRRLKEYYTYYISDNEGYCYDHLRKKSKEKGPKDIRKDLVNIMQVIGEEE